MIDRRRFLSYVPLATTGVIAGAAAVSASSSNYTIPAVETLMRGHGLLLRALIIYDNIKDRINKGDKVEVSWVDKSVDVFHRYLEEFHEHTEEKFVFAPLEKAKLHFDSIQELKVQHGTGYELNKRISQFAKDGKLGPDLAKSLNDFVVMYRHHAAWEDTVIFPAFDSLEGAKTLGEIAEQVTADEKRIIGDSGFESFIKQLAEIEKEMGIFQLSSSTAKL